MHWSHRFSAYAAAASLAGLLTACGTTSAQPQPTPSPSPTQRTPAPAPAKGSCYRLSYTEAIAPTTVSAPVPCRSKHTSVTFKVGTFTPFVEGHAVAVDSTAVQQHIAKACHAALPAWVGGEASDLRLSQVRTVWFSPSLSDSELGATWFRCDLVAVKAPQTLANLPRGKSRGLLNAGVANYASCATGEPGGAGTTVVMCSQPHTWVAASTYDFDKATRYLGKQAAQAASQACKTIAADRASDPLDYRYSFQWPSQAAWETGQRYGICWSQSST